MLVVAGLMAVVSGVASADVSTVFDAQGTLTDGAVLGGTMTIDTTTGVLTSADLTLTSPNAGIFSTVDTTGYFSAGDEYLTFVGETTDTTINALRLGLLTTSLVGFTGGNFASLDHLSPSTPSYTSDLRDSSGAEIDLVSGSLAEAPEIDAASAGSALTLLLGGLALLRSRERIR